jgi:hypothetical protein
MKKNKGWKLGKINRKIKILNIQTKGNKTKNNLNFFIFFM